MIFSFSLQITLHLFSPEGCQPLFFFFASFFHWFSLNIFRFLRFSCFSRHYWLRIFIYFHCIFRFYFATLFRYFSYGWLRFLRWSAGSAVIDSWPFSLAGCFSLSIIDTNDYRDSSSAVSHCRQLIDSLLLRSFRFRSQFSFIATAFHVIDYFFIFSLLLRHISYFLHSF